MIAKRSMNIAFAAAIAAFSGCTEQFAKKEGPKFRLAPIAKTDIVKTVEATGTVAPIKKVEVGAQVNGRIIKLFVDFNSHVTNGQVVALIDPQVYDAQYKSALAPRLAVTFGGTWLAITTVLCNLTFGGLSIFYCGVTLHRIYRALRLPCAPLWAILSVPNPLLASLFLLIYAIRTKDRAERFLPPEESPTEPPTEPPAEDPV